MKKYKYINFNSHTGKPSICDFGKKVPKMPEKFSNKKEVLNYSISSDCDEESGPSINVVSILQHFSLLLKEDYQDVITKIFITKEYSLIFESVFDYEYGVLHSINLHHKVIQVENSDYYEKYEKYEKEKRIYDKEFLKYEEEFKRYEDLCIEWEKEISPLLKDEIFKKIKKFQS